jgi:hypothetical protein
MAISARLSVTVITKVLTRLKAATATINTNGSVFLNGVQFGLESRW